MRLPPMIRMCEFHDLRVAIDFLSRESPWAGGSPPWRSPRVRSDMESQTEWAIPWPRSGENPWRGVMEIVNG